MNERIQELVKQATETVKCGLNGTSTAESFNRKKFAELIVRECMSLMNTEKEYYSNPGTYESREYYECMSAKKDAFDEAASIIKSHFGVE